MKKYITGKRLVVLTLVLVLTSCGITKKYESPTVSSTVQDSLFRDQTPTDSVSFADMRWQDVFTDQVLQGLIQEGLQNNNDLLAAVQRVAGAQAVFKQSKQAALPSVNVNPNVTYNHQSRAALNLPASININLKTTTVQLPIGATWEVDVWGKLRSTKRAALANFMQTSAAARAVQTQLIGAIATNYFQLMALDEQLRITNETILLRQKDVETLHAMKAASLVDGAALAQTEANLYAAQVSIPDLEQAIRETENALSILVGRVPGAIERTTLSEQHIQADLRTGVPLHLVKQRPDVEAAEMAFRSNFEQTNVARASFYPSLTLSARSGLSALTTNNLLSNSFFTTLAGGLLQPIYNNGLNKMNLRRAQAQQQEALFAFQQTILTAGVEVSNALFAYESSQRKEETRALQITALEHALSNTKELLEYSNTTNYLDVISAETGLLNAQLAGVNDRLQGLLSLVQLYRALGGGWN